MRNKYLWIVLSVAVATAAVVVVVFAGDPDNPPGPPESTSSYTLEHIYRRLDSGAAGTPITFTEPISGPGTGTMHTLNEIYDLIGERAPVPKTGQTDCYKSASPWGVCTCGDTDCPSGQDGDLEIGVVWPSPRFITSTTGIVTDTLTGLVWLQDADCLGYRSWADAMTQIGNLNSGTDFSCDNYTAGTFGDWRLPNLRELHSLLDYSQDDPPLPSGHPFTGVQGSYYWSGTTYERSQANAWCVSLYAGHVDALSKGSSPGVVWPVRGGQ